MNLPPSSPSSWRDHVENTTAPDGLVVAAGSIIRSDDVSVYREASGSIMQSEEPSSSSPLIKPGLKAWHVGMEPPRRSHGTALGRGDALAMMSRCQLAFASLNYRYKSVTT